MKKSLLMLAACINLSVFHINAMQPTTHYISGKDGRDIRFKIYKKAAPTQTLEEILGVPADPSHEEAGSVSRHEDTDPEKEIAFIQNLLGSCHDVELNPAPGKAKKRQSIFPLVHEWIRRQTGKNIETVRLNAENSNKLLQILESNQNELTEEDLDKIGQIITEAEATINQYRSIASHKIPDANKLTLAQITTQLRELHENRMLLKGRNLPTEASGEQPTAPIPNRAIDVPSVQIVRNNRLWQWLTAIIAPGHYATSLHINNITIQENELLDHMRNNIKNLVANQKNVRICTLFKSFVNGLMITPMTYFVLRPLIARLSTNNGVPSIMKHHSCLVTSLTAAASAGIISYAINKFGEWRTWNPRWQAARRQLSDPPLLTDVIKRALATECQSNTAFTAELEAMNKLQSH